MPVSRPWWRRPFAYLLRIRLRPRHLRDSLAHRLLGARLFEPSLWIPLREPVAKGAMIGVFLGFSPLIGLHLPLSILLCCALRANAVVAILSTFVSNPFTLVGLACMEVKLGQWMMPKLAVITAPHSGMAGYFIEYLRPFLLGSLVFSTVGGLLAYPLALWIWDLSERQVKRRQAGIAH